jgi:LAS superfamily LD-carboxypeptidase LdcB
MSGLSWDPQTLTGRASTHVVTLSDPSCTLHRDVVEPFLALRAAAAARGIDLLPVSSWRDFQRQLTIWNAKCRGERDLFDRQGELLDHASLTEDELVSAILIWSALPGASRHHWGTEVDVVDAAALPPGARPQLMVAEYVPGGTFERLEVFLREEAQRYGFYRPYAVDRGGVQPEPWHLSHAVTAASALEAFTPQMLRDALDGAELGAAPTVTARLPEIFDRYVVNVDPVPRELPGAATSPATRPS